MHNSMPTLWEFKVLKLDALLPAAISPHRL
jgi:hypothetical protein